MVLLLWPVGSTEPHGPHSPLATDPIISVGDVPRRRASLADDPEVQVLILPDAHYGVTRFTAGLPGQSTSRRRRCSGLIVDDISSRSPRQGFPHVLLVNNHFEPAHVKTLHRSHGRLEERPATSSASSI